MRENSTHRNSAFMFSAAMLAMGMLALLRRKSPAVFFGISGIAFVCGLFLPGLAGCFFSALKFLLRRAGVIVLSLFYFLVLTPWGMIYAFATGKKKERDSYWVARLPETRGKERYERQY